MVYVFYKYVCIYMKYIDTYISENENQYAKLSAVHKISLGLNSLSCSDICNIHPDIWVIVSILGDTGLDFISRLIN